MKCNGLNCENELTGKQEKWCSLKCKNRNGNLNHQVYKCQKERGLKRKRELLKIKGGCCEKCGYDKCIAALTFHHREPKKKLFQLDMRSLSNRTWEKILKELEKCDLLCSNCHLELHHGHLKSASGET